MPIYTFLFSLRYICVFLHTTPLSICLFLYIVIYLYTYILLTRRLCLPQVLPLPYTNYSPQSLSTLGTFSLTQSQYLLAGYLLMVTLRVDGKLLIIRARQSERNALVALPPLLHKPLVKVSVPVTYSITNLKYLIPVSPLLSVVSISSGVPNASTSLIPP